MSIQNDFKRLRNLILEQYNILIQLEESTPSDFNYTIINGKFSVSISRDSMDELDTLLQTLNYLKSDTHKFALSQAKVYQLHYESTSKYFTPTHILKDTYKKLIKSRQVKFYKNTLPQIGVQNISSFHCDNIIELDFCRDQLFKLYNELKWLKDTISQQKLNYDSLIHNNDTPNEIC